MKKFFVVLIMAVAAMTVNTKVGATGTETEVKNQYVKWGTVPQKFQPADLVGWLKKAAAGTSIQGASVRSTPGSYSTVWGQDLYNEVMSADLDRFVFGKSSGNEKNFALNEKSQPVFSGILNPGVAIIGFKRVNGTTVPIAKWGENGCLNAISEQSVGNDGLDPDNKTVGNPWANTNTNSNSVVNQFSEVSWSRGYEIYSHGRSDTKADIFDGMMMAKALSGSCCGTQGTSQGYAGAGTIIFSSGTTNGQGTEKKAFIDTWFGQTTSNAVGTALGIGLYNLADNLFDQNRNWNNGWNGPGWNWNTRNTGFVPVHGATGSGWNGGVSGWVGGGIATPGQLLGGNGSGFPW